jgi:ribonucleoside-diphosphate reductase alpha chain
MLILLGLKYNEEEGLKFIEKLYRFISKAAYEASVMLAVEKGPFPACNPEKHVESGFMKRMPKKIRALVKEHGIRNCAILTQAPTGTISILSGNCSAAIEPMFSFAYWRNYWDGEVRKRELCFHPLFKKFLDEGRDVSHLVAARELSIRDHMEVQRIVQNHMDNAVSKTINIAKEFANIDEMSRLWLEYLPYLKGTTFYREGSRNYVDNDGKEHEPPLVEIPLDEAIRLYNDEKERITLEKQQELDCATGVCEVK